jgi:hypothetical protein
LPAFEPGHEWLVARNVYNYIFCLPSAPAQRARRDRTRPPDNIVTSTSNEDQFAKHWKEIAACFLRLGLVAYGGLALMGMMQIELQEGATG